MSPPSHEPPTALEHAERIYVAALARCRSGIAVDLEALCAEHGAHARSLRLVHERWQAMARQLRETAERESLSDRLRERFGSHANPGISLQGEVEPATDLSSELLQRLSRRGALSGRYRFEGELARGGMGSILRVWDEDLRRHLAMKVVLEEHSEPRTVGSPRRSAPALARFLEEAQVTGQLDHPGIVPVHELGLDALGRVFFTMKLVKGKTLKTVFEELESGGGGWTQTRVLTLLLRVCEAMAYAHDKRVIHRDLKPANVMVGRFGEVYVMDWGLAKILDRPDGRDLRVRDGPAVTTTELSSDRKDGAAAAADSPLYTMDGDVVGTPAYMSPEQAAGRVSEMGPQADVYALGAMLYHLLAGHMPYLPPGTAANNYVIWQLVQRAPPDPLHERAPGAPAELVAICEKAMARDAASRYANMSELAEDLAAYVEGRVVQAYETGAWAEARKWVKRNRPLAVLGALLSVSVLAGLSGFSYVERQSTLALQESNVILAEERDKANSIKNFLTRMLTSADPSKGNRADLMVRDLLEQIDESVERELESQPEVGAELHLVLADAYSSLAMSERAVEQRRRTLEIVRRLDPGDSLRKAGLMIDVADGGVTIEDRSPEELLGDIAMAEEGIAMARRVGAPADMITNGEGTLTALVARQGRDLDAALELAVPFLYGVSKGKYTQGEIREWLRALPDRLTAAWMAGDTSTVSAVLREHCQPTIEDPFWGPQVPAAFTRYADMIDAHGRALAAEAVRYEALRIAEEVLPPESLPLARWRLRAAEGLTRNGRHAEALDLCTRACDVLLTSFGPSDANTIDGLVLLAQIHARRGDASTQRSTLERGLELVRTDLPPYHESYAEMVDAAALERLEVGDFGAARSLFMECIPALLARDDAGSSARLARLRYGLAQACFGLQDLDGAREALYAVLDWSRTSETADAADLGRRACALLEEVVPGDARTRLAPCGSE